MKKIYTLAALACACITAAAQQIDIENLTAQQIVGKYRLVSPQTVYYDDIYVDEQPLIVVDQVEGNTLQGTEFIYPAMDYDYNTAYIGITWEGEDGLNFQRDLNGDLYFYNSWSEEYWTYLWNTNFRLYPSLSDEGQLQFGRQEGASAIWFCYYGNGEYPACLGFEEGFTLVKQPVHTTVTKRNLPGTYHLYAYTDDGEVSYDVTIAQDGTNYLMTGLYGADDMPLTFTWDANGGGIRAKNSYEYDSEGYYVGGIGAYSPSEDIYISFDADGNLVFDYDLSAVIGDNFQNLYSIVLTKGVLNGVDHARTTPAHSNNTFDLAGRLTRQTKGQIVIENGVKVRR